MGTPIANSYAGAGGWKREVFRADELEGTRLETCVRRLDINRLRTGVCGLE